MGHSIKAGLASAAIGRVVVSTDSPLYQKIAIDLGAECPFLRAAELGGDASSSAELVHELIGRLNIHSGDYGGIVLLQPTSPLRSVADIEGAIALHRSSGAPAVVSVCEAECPPAWVGQLPASLSLDDFVPPQFKGKRSQDLGTWWRLNGAIYVIGIESFVRENGFMPRGTLAYVMPRSRSIDVDTAYDLALARLLIHANIVE